LLCSSRSFRVRQLLVLAIAAMIVSDRIARCGRSDCLRPSLRVGLTETRLPVPVSLSLAPLRSPVGDDTKRRNAPLCTCALGADADGWQRGEKLVDSPCLSVGERVDQGFIC